MTWFILECAAPAGPSVSYKYICLILLEASFASESFSVPSCQVNTAKSRVIFLYLSFNHGVRFFRTSATEKPNQTKPIGHYKTAIGFACKLLQERPSGLLITFISAGKHTELARIEVDNNFLHRNSSSKQNLRWVSVLSRAPYLWSLVLYTQVVSSMSVVKARRLWTCAYACSKNSHLFAKPYALLESQLNHSMGWFTPIHASQISSFAT